MLRLPSHAQNDPSVLQDPVRPPIAAGCDRNGYWTRRIVFASAQCRSSW